MYISLVFSSLLPSPVVFLTLSVFLHLSLKDENQAEVYGLGVKVLPRDGTSV